MGPLAMSLGKLLWPWFVSLISMSLAKVPLFWSGFSALPLSCPFLQSWWWRPTTQETSAKEQQLTLALQMICKLPPPLLTASFQSCRELVRSLQPWLSGLMLLWEGHWPRMNNPTFFFSLSLVTSGEGRACTMDFWCICLDWSLANSLISKKPKPQNYEGSPSHCRVCATHVFAFRRTGRFPLVQSPCSKTKKIYGRLGEAWLSI